MTTKIRKLIYQGKANCVYETDDLNKVVVKFKDNITAGNGTKKDNMNDKGF